jgi:hypothetical protein
MQRLAPGLRAATLGLLVLASGAPRAWAQTGPSAPAADARKQASRKFLEGTRAFDAGDFTSAGEAFDAAYALAPHPDALWNGARAWHKAGELARAANLYARYLREAPHDARDRNEAQAALKLLAPKLARIELQKGEGVSSVSVDGAPVDAPAVYVLPGAHLLRAQGAHGPIEQSQSFRAGDDVSVLLAEPAPAPSIERQADTVAPTPAAPAAPPTAPATRVVAPARDVVAQPAPQRSGWSPAVVFVEAGVTLAVAGVTTWSGLETLSTLHSFEANPTQGSLDTGRSEELRTNVLIGASIGLALLTAATAIFLVDWRGTRQQRQGLRIGPGFAAFAEEF